MDFMDLVGLSSAALHGKAGDLWANYLSYKKTAPIEQENALARMANEQEFNAAQAALTREFNASEAQKQRDFEEYMSNTSYQRAIADMKAAGINPASIAGGSGASTPSGVAANATSAYSGVPSSKGGIGFSNGSVFSNMLSSAINGMIAKDRDASKYLADEFRDNARHAHKMEEIAEWKSEKKAASSGDPFLGFEVL